jgi:hypothetical protein
MVSIYLSNYLTISIFYIFLPFLFKFVDSLVFSIFFSCHSVVTESSLCRHFVVNVARVRRGRDTMKTRGRNQGDQIRRMKREEEGEKGQSSRRIAAYRDLHASGRWELSSISLFLFPVPSHCPSTSPLPFAATPHLSRALSFSLLCLFYSIVRMGESQQSETQILREILSFCYPRRILRISIKFFVILL